MSKLLLRAKSRRHTISAAKKLELDTSIDTDLWENETPKTLPGEIRTPKFSNNFAKTTFDTANDLLLTTFDSLLETDIHTEDSASEFSLDAEGITNISSPKVI